MKPLALVALLCCLSGAAELSQSVPKLISYQGQLTNAGGTPVSGNVAFTFSLYAAPIGGTALWTENQTIAVANGVFNVQLGSVTPLTAAVFASDTVYLGIKVGTDVEATPRQRVTASAYSVRGEVGVVPIGTIVAWHKSLTGTPALPEGWAECNGQAISDLASPYYGQVTPNLNNNKLFLRGNTISGASSGSESHVHVWYDQESQPSSWDSHRIGIGTVYNNSRKIFSYGIDGITKQEWGSGNVGIPQYTNKQSHIPSNFEIVWIIRVK